MATTGLLALLDDITVLLDDVALYSKFAAKKSAGVLGDDLALNAQQVSGFRRVVNFPWSGPWPGAPSSTSWLSCPQPLS